MDGVTLVVLLPLGCFTLAAAPRAPAHSEGNVIMSQDGSE